MNIILMTILLTLLGAGLVVLLVWLSVVSCRAIKFKKDSILNFNNLEKKHEEMITSFYREVEQIYTRIEENKKSIEEKLSKFEEELHREVITSIYNRIDEVSRDSASHTEEVNRCLQDQFKNVWNHFTEVERLLDSRFDKQFKSINDLNQKLSEQKSDNPLQTHYKKCKK